MRGLILLAFAVLLSQGAGCMSMIANRYTDVTVTTNPARAKVTCAGQTILAPGVLRLRSDESHTIRVTLEGHYPREARVESGHSASLWVGSFFLNTAVFGWWSIFIGTAIGMGVDAGTGSLKEVEPRSVFVALEPVPPPPVALGPEAR